MIAGGGGLSTVSGGWLNDGKLLSYYGVTEENLK
jgi:hypothetical protein